MGIMLAVVIFFLLLAIIGLGWMWLVARPKPQRHIEYRKVSDNRDHRWNAAVARSRGPL